MSQTVARAVVPAVLPRAVLLVALLVGLLGPGAVAAAPAAVAATAQDEHRPFPTTGSLDYQLGGAYAPAPGVTVVVRDVTSHPAPGLFSVCYLNGFQTQPGTLRSTWAGPRRSLLLRTASGSLARDPGWPDEVLLDTSTAHRHARIARVLARQVARCARKGFDAVELDNLDSWQRSHGRLTARDNLGLARRLIRAAHAHGLLVAQKNAVEITRRAHRAGFDLAITEDCRRWHECGAYRRTYGARVLMVEYHRAAFRRSCAARHPGLVVYRDHDLVRRGRPGYRFRTCPAS
jgi:hypothetical protein